MKIRKIIIALFTGALLMSGCEQFQQKHGGEVKNVRYAVTQAKDDYTTQLTDSYKDDRFWYYMYYLGYISNVPLQEVEGYNYSGSNYKKSFTTTTTTEKYVESACEFASQKTTTWEEELVDKIESGMNIEFTTGAEIGTEAGGEAAGATAKVTTKTTFEETVGYSLDVSAQWGNTWGGSENKTYKDTFVEAETYSVSKSDTTEFEFTSESKYGYYRYVLMGAVKVFALIAYDPITNLFTVDNIESVAAKNWHMDYSENPFFNDNNYGHLEFDVTQLTSFEEPEKYFKSESGDSNIPSIPETQLSDFDGGQGTKEDPYIIKGIVNDGLTQLLKIKDNLDKHFKLETDIDFSNYSPQAYNTIIPGNFTGSLNGNGHKITNIDFNLTYNNMRPTADNKYSISLFDNVDGTISNLKFENCKMLFESYHNNGEGNRYSYAFVTSRGSGKIENIEFKNVNLTINGKYTFAGFVAATFHGQILNCKVTDSYLFTNGDAGGIVGDLFGEVRNCTIQNTTYYYWCVSYPTSMGGVAATIRDNALIEFSGVTNCKFIIHNDDEYKDCWLCAKKHHNPKIGYIVGDAISGRIWQVFYGAPAGNIRTLEAGHPGDNYFSVGEWAGRCSSSVEVK